MRCTASQRGELRDLVQIFRLGVIDVSHTTMTLEVQGREDKMSAIADLLEPYGEPPGLMVGHAKCVCLYRQWLGCRLACGWLRAV